MITIDNEKLISKLQETCLKYYEWEVPYFIVESINIVFDEEDNNYSLVIKGRAGDEERTDSEIRFDIMINPGWSYDFIQGYFQRELELGGRK